jgi:KDO2-lipid IV(A) lauroyltransferase
VRVLLRFLAWLSLAANRRVGALAGRLAFGLAPGMRRRARANLRSAGFDAQALLRRNAEETGMGATELAWALFRPVKDVVALVSETDGWEAVERLREQGRAILFITPHLGGYDVAGRWLWSKLPILAMYRPHKNPYLDDLMREGRNRGAAPDGTNVAPATRAGVRMLLTHLRRGGCSIVLPDQVPGEGEGEWVEFFGRPAYTMTLPGRLQKATGAVIVFCFAERLAGAAGFRLVFRVREEPLPEDRASAALAINAGVEALIRMAPSQYLWSYNRYKRPAGAPAAPA